MRRGRAIVADRNTPAVYCRTNVSRERDVDVSNLLVLIKKSHKVSVTLRPARDTS